MNDDLYSVAEQLRFLEEQLLEPEIRRDAATIAALLADDFREFGSSGRIYTKPEILAALIAEAPHEIILHDFAYQPLTEEIALVTYRSRSEGTQALRSSLWVHREDRWQMLFHQGTKLTSPTPSSQTEAVS